MSIIMFNFKINAVFIFDVIVENLLILIIINDRLNLVIYSGGKVIWTVNMK
jgi:hypothetical protein